MKTVMVLLVVSLLMSACQLDSDDAPKRVESGCSRTGFSHTCFYTVKNDSVTWIQSKDFSEYGIDGEFYVTKVRGARIKHECVYPLNDNAIHCGACGNVCEGVCDNGVCKCRTECKEGWTCGPQGTCVENQQ